MIPSSQKVNQDLFKLLIKEGRSAHSAHFSFRYMFVKGLKQSHFSIVVAKKIEKTAVGRNKIKRAVFVIMESFLTQTAPEAVGAFFVKQKWSKIEEKHIQNEIKNLLTQSRFIVDGVGKIG